MEEKLNEKHMEYQYLIQQIQQLQQNLAALEKHVLDLTNMNENLREISKNESYDEVLMPFGGGIFFRSKISDSRNVVMNVGAGICVEKSTDDASRIVSEQTEHTRKAMEQLQEEFANAYVRIQELQAEFENAKSSKK